MNRPWPTQTFTVLPGMVGPGGALRPQEALRLMQDFADITLVEQSKGTYWMADEDLGWMTRAYHLRFDRPLLEGEGVTLTTAFCPLGDSLSLRRFCFYVDDQPVGRADSSWMLVRRSTRKVTRLSRGLTQGYFDFCQQLGDVTLPERERPLWQGESWDETISLRWADYDCNGHVNNTVYGAFLSQGARKNFASGMTSLELTFCHEIKTGPVLCRSWSLGEGLFGHYLYDGDGQLCSWGRTQWSAL